VNAVDTETELGLDPGAEVEVEVAAGLDPGYPVPQPIVMKINAIMLIRNDFFMQSPLRITRAMTRHTSGVERRHPASYLGEIL
jgi:hypothetical protein